MSEPNRPTISAGLLAQIIQDTPTRVTKRLDRKPDSAKQWEWILEAESWKIKAGEEAVTLTGSTLDKPEQISCTCLLSPKCFHILACVSILTIGESTGPPENPGEEQASVDDTQSIEINDSMRLAAKQALAATETVLMIGARACGTAPQSTILVSADRARVIGLHRLSNGLIRVIEGIQRLRSSDNSTDCEQLRRDMVSVINDCSAILGNDTVAPFQIGVVRREYHPVSIARLTGYVAEPILTLSGYAGISVHLRANDGQSFQVLELRPGETSLVRQGYSGGIDLGEVTSTGKHLCRATLDVQNMTASPDGRLGKGKKTRWAFRDVESDADLVWSPEPLSSQIERVFELADTDPMTRHSGWDFVQLSGKIQGASSDGVAMQCEGLRESIRLVIENDHPSLPFRENLQMLSRCVDLQVNLIGRLQLDRAGQIAPLTLLQTKSAENEIKLQLPKSWRGRCQLGFDSLKRHHVSETTRFAEEVRPNSAAMGSDQTFGPPDRLFPGLDQRLTTLAIGGRGAFGSPGSHGLVRDRQRLTRRLQTTASELLELVATAASGTMVVDFALSQSFAAADGYCQHARLAYQHQRWMELVSSDEALNQP